MSISAPYNFVPLSSWVYRPEWAAQVSHDLPFREGLCGHLDLSIEAVSPLLVGGVQQPATAQAAGVVKPFQLPDGRYAIPGSSLKGAIRNIIEIASFSRMNRIDDRRFGLRDISGKHVKETYTKLIRNKIECGFLRLTDQKRPVIIPCEMVRLSHKDLANLFGCRLGDLFRVKRTVKAKYEDWQRLCDRYNVRQSGSIAFERYQGKYDACGKPLSEQQTTPKSQRGVPVFTGQISGSDKKSGKKYDFIFYNQKPDEAIAVDDAAWRDFLFVHGEDEEPSRAADMSWPGYWKERFWQGKSVPIFYIPTGNKLRIGLAYMPRLASDFSVQELLDHTSPDHRQADAQGAWDFATTLFGTVGDESHHSLKGRVTFSHAINENGAHTNPQPATILNGPKASFFPNYLQQQCNGNDVVHGEYNTYMDREPKPQLRGWKRYPIRDEQTVKVQQLTTDQESNRKVQVQLNPLNTGARFSCRVQFHNLRPEELGALCWALTWGGAQGARHSLGMGKPFGFGQVHIAITDAVFEANHPSSEIQPWQGYRDRFITHMEEMMPKHASKKSGWRTSPQIRTLLAMAQVVKPPHRLEHMILGVGEGHNPFQKAKNEGHVLPPYCEVDHPELWSEVQRREQEAAAEEARRAEEAAAEEARQAAAEAERMRYEQLADEEKLLYDVEQAWQAWQHRQPTSNDIVAKEQFSSQYNKLMKGAATWPDQALREQAANLLTSIFDGIGWHDGGDKKKREKKEAKRRREVETLRKPN